MFCDDTSGVPFGGDDSGFVAADVTVGRCEDRAAAASATLVRRLVTCHTRLTRGQLADEQAEEWCEMKAVARFERSVEVLTGCPTCLDPVGIVSVAEAIVDGNNGLIFCASPSGAFVAEPYP